MFAIRVEMCCCCCCKAASAVDERQQGSPRHTPRRANKQKQLLLSERLYQDAEVAWLSE
jgi:hypothetical protein